jgi:hypothetical protein
MKARPSQKVGEGKQSDSTKSARLGVAMIQAVGQEVLEQLEVPSRYRVSAGKIR